MICETLQTGRSLFAGLPELHDKMNGFFSNVNFKKKNTRLHPWLKGVSSHLKRNLKEANRNGFSWQEESWSALSTWHHLEKLYIT